MKDEIKELLDKLEDKNWYDELDLTGTKWIELKWEETHLLLDYITNLQEENEELKKNQRYHKKFGNDYIFCLENDKETYKDNIFELQERIEKAIDYIKNINERAYKDDYGTCFSTYDLLNILQGD